MRDRLIELIAKIRERLKQPDSYPNEAAVSQKIVLPVLAELNWDPYDTHNTTDDRQVRPQYDLKTNRGARRVDYALLIGGTLHVIIEVKAVGRTEGDQQLFEYAFHSGAPLAILTDGREWSFYLSAGKGGYSERLVRTLSIPDQPSEKVADYLRCYLGFEEVKSEKAFVNARKDLDDKENKARAKQSIPKAWQRMVDEPNEQLVNLLIEKTAQGADGGAPDKSDVIAFLRNLISRLVSSSESQRPPPKSDPINHSKKRASPSPMEGKITYTLLGSHHNPINAIEGYKHIIKELGARDPSFLKKLELEFIGKKGIKHLSRRKEDMRHAFVHIGSGWYLNTNISNVQKKSLLKVACHVAGITFGKDLKINCPAH